MKSTRNETERTRQNQAERKQCKKQSISMGRTGVKISTTSSIMVQLCKNQNSEVKNNAF